MDQAYLQFSNVRSNRGIQFDGYLFLIFFFQILLVQEKHKDNIVSGSVLDNVREAHLKI